MRIYRRARENTVGREAYHEIILIQSSTTNLSITTAATRPRFCGPAAEEVAAPASALPATKAGAEALRPEAGADGSTDARLVPAMEPTATCETCFGLVAACLLAAAAAAASLEASA